MAAFPVDPTDDIAHTTPTPAIALTVDGRRVTGVAGQTIAGVLLAAGETAWRETTKGRPRGVFCGIGICFDCLAEVNGLRDVRTCQRRAADGDVVVGQRDGAS